MTRISEIFYGVNTNNVLLKKSWDPEATGQYPPDATEGIIYVSDTNGTVDGIDFKEDDLIIYKDSEWIPISSGGSFDPTSSEDISGNWTFETPLSVDTTGSNVRIGGTDTIGGSTLETIYSRDATYGRVGSLLDTTRNFSDPDLFLVGYVLDSASIVNEDVVTQYTGIADYVTGVVSVLGTIVGKDSSGDIEVSSTIQSSDGASAFASFEVAAGSAGSYVEVSADSLNLNNDTMLELGKFSAEPTGLDSNIYYNSTLNKFRAYENGSWEDLIGSSALPIWNPIGYSQPELVSVPLSSNTSLVDNGNGVTVSYEDQLDVLPASAVTTDGLTITTAPLGQYFKIQDTVKEDSGGYLFFGEELSNFFTYGGNSGSFFWQWDTINLNFEVTLTLDYFDNVYGTPNFSDSITFTVDEIRDLELCLTLSRLSLTQVELAVYINEGANTATSLPTQTLIVSTTEQVLDGFVNGLIRSGVTLYSQTGTCENILNPAVEYSGVIRTLVDNIVDPSSYPVITEPQVFMVGSLPNPLRVPFVGEFREGFLVGFDSNGLPKSLATDESRITEQNYTLSGEWDFNKAITFPLSSDITANLFEVSSSVFITGKADLGRLIQTGYSNLVDTDDQGDFNAENGKRYLNAYGTQGVNAVATLPVPDFTDQIIEFSQISAGGGGEYSVVIGQAEYTDGFIINGKPTTLTSVTVSNGKRFMFQSGGYDAGSGSNSSGAWHLFDLSSNAVEVKEVSGTSYNITYDDNNRVIRITDSNPITVTIDSDYGTTLNFVLEQGGDGKISWDGLATVNNIDSHTQTRGKFAQAAFTAHGDGEFTVSGATE
jgi:hypothetical protein